MALDIVAWHDRTSVDHQTQYNNARIAGYSTISLRVYGDANNPRYAAAMVKRAGQATEQQFLNLNSASLQSTFKFDGRAGIRPGDHHQHRLNGQSALCGDLYANEPNSLHAVRADG